MNLFKIMYFYLKQPYNKAGVNISLISCIYSINKHIPIYRRLGGFLLSSIRLIKTAYFILNKSILGKDFIR